MKKTLSIVFVLSAFACAPMIARAEIIIGGPSNLKNGNMDVTYPEVIVDNDPPGPDPGDFRLAKPAVWINDGSRTLTGPYEDDMSSEPWAGNAAGPTPLTYDASLLNQPNGCGSGPLDHDCGVFFKPFSGGGTNGPATSHLYQDNPAVPGKTYVLSGWIGAEPNALMTDAQLAIDFLGAGDSLISSSILSVLPTLFVDNGLQFDYKEYSVSGVAPAGTVEVRARFSMIGATGNPLGGGQALVVDDFTLSAVPEPASLMLVGMGLIGLAGIRRRG